MTVPGVPGRLGRHIAIDPNQTDSASAGWTLTCADCQASWQVRAEAIFAGDDWLACPRCGRTADDSSHPAPIADAG